MSITSSKTSWFEAGFLAAVGAFLIAAAVLKGYEFSYYTTYPSNLVLVVPEYFLGVWMMSGLYGRAARLVAMLVFAGFLEAALWAAIAGQKSCGCMGIYDVNPRLMVGVDLVILAGLVLLRSDMPQRTVVTHRLRYRGALAAALAFGVPGFLTMTVFKRESPRAHELRHDRTLHGTRVAVDLQRPTAQDLAGLLAEAGIRVGVDEAVMPYFDASRPAWKPTKDRTYRSWAILESISGGTAVKTRWIISNEVYLLIEDDPLRRSKFYWLAGLAFGALSLCWLAWDARQGGARMDTSAGTEGLPNSSVLGSA